MFAIDKANDELFRLVGVAICMAIPLLIGYFFPIIYSLGPLARWAFIRLFIISRFLLPQLLRRLNIVGFLLFWATA